MNLGMFHFLCVFLGTIGFGALLCTCLHFCINIYPNRKPRISQFKMMTDGKSFKLKYRGRLLEVDHIDDYKQIKIFRDSYLQREMEIWKTQNKRWVNISNEKTIKKYLKHNPEFLENL